MKLISKTILILLSMSFGQALFARDIILIENQASLEEGKMLVEILIKKFHLPRELMTLKNINQNCETKTDAIVHLCVRRDGELEIRKFNQYVVRNSLGIFLNQEDKGVE